MLGVEIYMVWIGVVMFGGVIRSVTVYCLLFVLCYRACQLPWVSVLCLCSVFSRLMCHSASAAVLFAAMVSCQGQHVRCGTHLWGRRKQGTAASKQSRAK